ncbi:MAG: serine hydrolase domain-containing protein, partial [Gammaproteobacteria bacterium]
GVATADTRTVNNFKAERNGFDLERLEKLATYLDDQVESGVLPNAAVYIWRNGKLVWGLKAGYLDIQSKRPIRNDTLFRMFSMTKPITAAAVMLLVDDGLVLLDEPLSLYLPEFKEMQVLVPSSTGEYVLEPASQPIRVRDLLTHTAGLSYNFIPTPVAADYVRLGIEPGNPVPTNDQHQSLQSMVEAVATLPLVTQPGSSWHYSVSLDVAGRLIEVVTGQRFEEFLHQRLLRPLKMVDTDFQVQPPVAREKLTALYAFPPANAPSGTPLQLMDPVQEVSGWVIPPKVVSGGGGLVGTGADYMNFAVMLLNKGRFKGQQILSRRASEQMLTNQMSPEYGTAKNPWPSFMNTDVSVSGVGHGLGGAVYLDYGLSDLPLTPGSYTWGGAAGTLFWVDPEKDMAVVFLTQVLELGEGKTEALQGRMVNLVYQALED